MNILQLNAVDLCEWSVQQKIDVISKADAWEILSLNNDISSEVVHCRKGRGLKKERILVKLLLVWRSQRYLDLEWLVRWSDSKESSQPIIQPIWEVNTLSECVAVMLNAMCQRSLICSETVEWPCVSCFLRLFKFVVWAGSMQFY